MSGKTYTIRIDESSGRVTMMIPDFAHLAGELGNFGVDVEILKDTTPGEITFRLTEKMGEQ